MSLDKAYRSSSFEKKKSFRCSECDKAFYSSGHLAAHVKVVHLKEKPFNCSE